MLRLGAKVRIQGQDAMIVARTLGAVAHYDLRLRDGTIIHYASAADFELAEVDLDSAGLKYTAPRAAV